MQRTSFRLAVLLMLSLVAGTVAAADLSGAKVDYSADSYFETAEIRMKSKVYHAPGKERREMETAGGRQIMIVRWDRRVSWMVMPSENMYMETALRESETDASGYKIEKSEVVGEETIDGVKTTKNKVIVSDTKGNKFGGFTWVTKDGITMKMDAISVDAARGDKTRMKMELKNVQVARQDPQLFEVPAGYTKIDMGALPKGVQDMMKGTRK